MHFVSGIIIMFTLMWPSLWAYKLHPNVDWNQLSHLTGPCNIFQHNNYRRGGDTARFTKRDISCVRQIANVGDDLMDLVRLAHGFRCKAWAPSQDWCLNKFWIGFTGGFVVMSRHLRYVRLLCAIINAAALFNSVTTATSQLNAHRACWFYHHSNIRSFLPPQTRISSIPTSPPCMFA